MRYKRSLLGVFKVRKEMVGALFCCIVIAAMLLLCIGRKAAGTIETSAVPMSGRVIVIDPGHGGML